MYYAETFRDAPINLRTGAIETWRSYDAIANLGPEPALKFIASIGEGLENCGDACPSPSRTFILRSIALQTEATRNNQYEPRPN